LEAQKWVNSLKAVRDGVLTNDPLDSARYEKQKIYSRVTGKSMYKEYDTLLESYEEKIHEVIEAKLTDHLQKRKKWKQIETVLGKAVKKELENRKALYSKAPAKP